MDLVKTAEEKNVFSKGYAKKMELQAEDNCRTF